jgi:hypothetical protein
MTEVKIKMIIIDFLYLRILIEKIMLQVKEIFFLNVEDTILKYDANLAISEL